MDYSPHVTDLNKWKSHFIDMASTNHSKNKKMYTVGRQSGGSEPSVQLVTPTEQAVQMAKADLKRKRKPINRLRTVKKKQKSKKPIPRNKRKR